MSHASRITLPAGASTPRIARAFGARAAYYDTHAQVQRAAADRLGKVFASLLPHLPPGPVLEVGCGTGFLSREIVRACPDREIEITDASEAMVEFTRRRIAGQVEDPRVRFHPLDGESVEAGTERGRAAVLAGLVAQWFAEPGAGLARLASTLIPGGALVASVPLAGSFPEWSAAAESVGIPFHAASLPEAPTLLSALTGAGLRVESFEEEHRERHANALEFFRHLKRIGAATRVEGDPLLPGAFRALLERWSDEPVTATYRILFLRAHRREG